MDIKLPFGVREDGSITHISEITEYEKGMRCNCTCPQCGQDLIARIGKVRTPHFAHKNQECKYATETAIHKFAKEVLKRNMKIALPKLEIIYNEENFKIIESLNNGLENIDRRNLKSIKITDEFVLKFDNIKLEKHVGSIIPDVVVYKNGTPLIIEIAITHFIDAAKKDKIRNLNISTIEINLNLDDLEYSNFDRNKVESIIINKIDNKTWIYNRKEEIKKAIILEKQEQLIEKKIKDRIVQRKKEKQINLERIKKLEVNSEKILLEYDKNLENNRMWLSISSELNINKSNIPDYLNYKAKGEIAFNCNRRIWQSCIYKRFILRRENTIVYIRNVENWIQSETNFIWHREYNSTNDFDKYMKSSLLNAIIDFFNNLVSHGILKRKDYFNNIYSSYEVKNDLFLEITNYKKETNNLEKIAKCEICGCVTSDWIVYYGKSKNTCICRKCRLSNKG